MLDGIEFLLFITGLVFTLSGITRTFQSKTDVPPLPIGWVFGLLLSVLGSSSVFGSLVIILSLQRRVLYYLVVVIFGGCMVYMGFNSIEMHPIEFPICPCPDHHYGENCLPCVGVDPNSTIVNICNGHGTCDDTINGTGVCFCDFNWRGSDECDVCTEHFDGAECETCDRQWTGVNCDTCYPGYTGSECNMCSDGWDTVWPSDQKGVLCNKCLEGHYGPFCTKCDSCTTHDSLAFCRDNKWHDETLYDANICSPTPNACNNDYDCTSSYNCKGKCVEGGLTNEILCSTDLDCKQAGFGTCEFKSCCAESKFGDGHCECQRVGYFGPKCEPCPGFDNVYTSSICAGHGTCQTSYVKGEYKQLICNCNFEEDGFWSGPECGCFKETVDGDCTKCANGYFGPNCDMCPGGGGVSQCSLHGECSDGLAGAGICSCDLDTKRNGLGAWGGDSCSTCLSSDFYGGMCQTCPLFTFIGCDAYGELTPFGETGNCVSSCGTKTCSDDGVCITCSAGKFMNSQRRCEDCQPGSVSPQEGTDCITCVEGKYQNEAGKTVCKDCPSGRSTDGSRGAASCSICQQGQYSNSGDPSCTTCPRGTYNPLVEQEKCQNCAVGTHNNVTGQQNVTSCKDCEIGKFTNTEGSPECKWCDLHAAQNVTGQTECVKCRAGQMVYPVLVMEGLNDGTMNETECESIYDYWELYSSYGILLWSFDKPSGCFKSGVNVYFNMNNYSVVNCSSTNKCIQKPNYCLNCSAHWSSIPGDYCRECPGGKFTEAGGICRECDPGRFSKSTGDGCIDCALGTYNTEGGLYVCQDCPYGKTTTSVGTVLQKDCVNCPSGKVSHKYEYRGLASCVTDSSNRVLVYEGLDEHGNNDNPGEDEAAQATACYTRCKSYRIHTMYDEPTPPPEILTQAQCKKYSEDHHLSWAGDDYTSAEYPKGCFIWQNGIHYNLNNFSTGNCNFNSAQCIILPSLMYSKAYNSTAFTLNVLSQPGRCYCELDTYETCTSKLEGYLEREWKYFNLDLTESVLCKNCILGSNSSVHASYCNSCKAGSYGTIDFVVVDNGGYNDDSISREECKQLSIQENGDTWAVNSRADRPVGCYRSGNQWRYNYNGERQCGEGTDDCIQKVKTSCESCAVGQFENRVHSDHCKICPDGQYQNKAGQDKCEAWHLCVAGEEETVVPTKDSDRDCAKCSAGKASDVIYYQTPENCQQKDLAILNREECLTAYNNAFYRTGLKGNRSLFHCYDGVGGTCEESYEVHWNGTITNLSQSTIYGTTWEDYSEHTYESWQQFCSAWPNNNNVFNGGLGGCTTPVPMLRVPVNVDVGYGIQSHGCVLSQDYLQTYFGPSLLLNRQPDTYNGWGDRIYNVNSENPWAYGCSSAWSKYNFQYSCGSKYFCRLYESCQECPAGTYTDLEGSSECLKCADGTSSLSGDTVCNICEAGTSSNKIWNENDAIVYNMTQELIFQDQEPLENVGSSARCKERCNDAFIFDRKDGCRCSLEKPTWGRFRRRMLLEPDVTTVNTDTIKIGDQSIWENLLSCAVYANIATQPKYECAENKLYSVTYNLPNFPWQLFYPKMTSLIQECKAIYDADTRSKWWNGKTHNPWMPAGCAAVNPDYRGIMHYEFNTHVGPKYRQCGDIFYNTPIECYDTGETLYTWNKDATTGCTNCGEGTFAEEEASECTSCGTGKYNPNAKSTSAAACVECPPSTISTSRDGCCDVTFTKENYLQTTFTATTLKADSVDQIEFTGGHVQGTSWSTGGPIRAIHNRLDVNGNIVPNKHLVCVSNGLIIEVETRLNTDKYVELKEIGAKGGFINCAYDNATYINHEWDHGDKSSSSYGGGNGYSIYTLTGKLCGACHLNYLDSDKSTFCSMCPINTFHSQGKCEFCPQHKHNNLTYIEIPLLEKFGEPDLTVREDDCKAYGESQIAIITSGLSEATQLQFLSATECQAYATDTERAWSGASGSNGNPKGCIIINSNTIHESVMYNTLTQDAACNNQARCVQKAWHSADTWTDRPRGCAMASDGRVFFNKEQSTFACGAGDWTCIKELSPHMGKLQIYMKSQVPYYLGGSQVIYINENKVHETPWKNMGIIMSRLKYNRGWEMEDTLVQNPWSDDAGGTDIYKDYLNAFQHGDMLVMTTIYDYYRSEYHFNIWKSILRDDFGSIYVDEITADDRKTTAWMFVGIKGEAPILELFDKEDIEKTIKINRGFCDSCPVGTDSTATSDCFASHPGEKHDLDVTYRKGNVALTPGADKITIRVASAKSNTLLVYDGTSSVAPITGNSGAKVARLKKENFTWVYDTVIDSDNNNEVDDFIRFTKPNEMIVFAQLGGFTFLDKTKENLQIHFGITVPTSVTTTTDDDEFSFVAIKSISQPLYAGRAQWIQFPKTKTTVFSNCLQGTYQDERKQVVCKECEAGKGGKAGTAFTSETAACETCVAGKVSKNLQCSQCPTGRFNPNSGLQDITAKDGYSDNLHSLTKEECRQWATDNDYPLHHTFDTNYEWVPEAYGCWLYQNGQVYYNTVGEGPCAGGWQYCVQKSCQIAPVGTFTNAEKSSTDSCPAGKLYNIDVKQNDKLILSYRSSGMPDHTVSSQECNGAATSTESRPSGCYKLSNGNEYYNNLQTDVPCSSEAWCVVKIKESTFESYAQTQGKADESITQEECMAYGSTFSEVVSSGRPYGCYRTSSDSVVYFNMQKTDVDCSSAAPCIQKRPPNDSEIGILVNAKSRMPQIVHVGHTVKVNPHFGENGGVVATRLKMNSAGEWEYFRHLSCEYDTFELLSTSENTKHTMTVEECKAYRDKKHSEGALAEWRGLRNDLNHPPGCFVHGGYQYFFNEGWLNRNNQNELYQYRACGYANHVCIERVASSCNLDDFIIPTMLQNEMLVLSFHKYIEISDALRTFLTTNLKATIPRAGHSNWVVHEDYTLVGIYGKKPMREGPSAELIIGKTWLHDSARCTYTYYGHDKACYCSSPTYGGLDGRYGYGDSNRYTGGWATANSVISSAACKSLCDSQPECKFEVAEVCDNCPLGKFSADTAAVTCKTCREGFRGRNYIYKNHSAVPSTQKLAQLACKEFGKQIGKSMPIQNVLFSTERPTGCFIENGNLFYNIDNSNQLCSNTYLCILNTSAFGNQRSNEENGCTRCRNGYQSSNISHLVCQQCSAGMSLSYHEEVNDRVVNDDLSLSLEECKEVSLMEEDTPWVSGNEIAVAEEPYGCIRLWSPSNSRYIVYFNSYESGRFCSTLRPPEACLQATYEIAEGNTIPDLSIPNAVECERAAKSVGLTYQYAGSWGIHVSGCFIHIGSNVYWNSHVNGLRCQNSRDRPTFYSQMSNECLQRRKRCKQCKPGTIDNGGDRSTCTKCLAGKFTDGSGRISCSDCGANKLNPSMGQNVWKFQTKGYPKKDVTYQECASYANDIDESSFHEISTDLQPAGCTYRYDNGYTYYNTKNNHWECGSTTSTGTYACLVKTCTDCQKGSRLTDTNPYVINIGTTPRKNVNREECLEFAHYYCNIHSSTCDTGNEHFLYVLQNYHNTDYPTGCFLYTTAANRRRFYYNNAISSTSCNAGRSPSGCVEKKYEYVQKTDSLPDLLLTKDECRHYAWANDLSWRGENYIHSSETIGCFLYDSNKIYYNNLRPFQNTFKCSDAFKCIEKKNVCTKCNAGKYHKMNIQPTNQTLTPVAGKFTVEFNSYSGCHLYTHPVLLWNDTTQIVAGNPVYDGWRAVRLRYSNQWEFHSVNTSGYLWGGSNPNNALATKEYLEEFEDGDMLILGNAEVGYHAHIYSVLTSDFGAKLITNGGHSWKPYHLIAIKGVGVIHEEYLESGCSGAPLRRHLPYLQFDKVTPTWTCDACPTGYYQDQTGQVGCKACDLGKYHIYNNALPGSALASHCQNCPAGKYQNRRGQNFCWECDPGHTTSGGTGAVACTACPAGKKQAYYTSSSSQDNTVSKEECSAIKDSAIFGAKTEPTFVMNNAGAPPGCYIYNSDNQVYWNNIPQTVSGSGLFSVKEYTSCSNCDAGKISSQDGSTECTDCLAGTIAATSGLST